MICDARLTLEQKFLIGTSDNNLYSSEASLPEQFIMLTKLIVSHIS